MPLSPTRHRLAALAAALTLAPGEGGAHPHVFIDGGIDFLFGDDGRLQGVRVTWIYDPLSSLFMQEDLDLDPTGGPLGAADRARLAAYQTDWAPGFEGDSYLWDGARRVALSGPRDAGAELRDGLAVITFRRDVETPFRPGAGTVAKVYDPSYFTAYRVTEPPALEGEAAGCRTEVVPFGPTSGLLALQQDLLAIPIDADPRDQDVGALFAEKVFITCD